MRRWYRRGGTALGLLLLLAASVLPLVAAADLPGKAHGTMAVVFAPGTSSAAAVSAVAAADGLLVRGGGWSNVLVVRSDQTGFAQRLRDAGAWLVLDPQSAAGCLFAGETA